MDQRSARGTWGSDCCSTPCWWGAPLVAAILTALSDVVATATMPDPAVWSDTAPTSTALVVQRLPLFQQLAATAPADLRCCSFDQLNRIG